MAETASPGKRKREGEEAHLSAPRAIWTQVVHKTGEAPKARSSHGTSFINGSLYVWGGEHIARHAIDSEVHAFRPHDACSICEGAWSQIRTSGDKPESRVAHSQAAIDDKLYIFGGRQGVEVGDGDLNDMHMLNLGSNEWSKIEYANDPPSARSFHQMVSAQDKLYVFGGCPGHERASDLWEFDPATATWTKLPDQGMKGRGGAGFTTDAAGENLFVFAGFAGEETNDCYRYNIASATWTSLESEDLRKRSVFGLCTLGDQIAIFGGEVDPSAHGHSGAGDFANDVVVFDTKKLTFRNLGDEGAPLARGWTRVAACGDNSFLLFGGLAGDDDSPLRLDDLWKCTLGT